MGLGWGWGGVGRGIVRVQRFLFLFYFFIPNETKQRRRILEIKTAETRTHETRDTHTLVMRREEGGGGMEDELPVGAETAATCR